ncbi:MAG TPA: D-glycerate dehydrogenase [bacterium]|nr:D-glycerate dehydrogenase [bacterium]
MRPKVLITSKIPSVAFTRLKSRFQVTWNKSQLTEDQLAARIRPYHALLSTLADPITARVLQQAPQLRCVANYAVGFNNIDLDEAKKRGIWVTNTPDVLTEATADIAWALILACARRLPEGEEMIHRGRFKGWHPLMLRGLDLEGKTLGLFGFGRIGKATARRAKGWNMRILYHQRNKEKGSVEKAYGARFVTFQTLLKESDILSLHAPLTPETFHRFTSSEFRKMRPNSIFINTSRGALHSEKDLILALKKGPLFAAGLDVYEKEPKIERGLLDRPNAVLLPHLGSATLKTRDRMAELCAENIRRVLLGHRPLTPIFNIKSGK